MLPRTQSALARPQRAFNAELATVKDTVRGNAMAGKLRLQWWRDTVGAIYEHGEPGEHPVALALADAVRRFGFSRQWLERMLDARVRVPVVSAGPRLPC